MNKSLYSAVALIALAVSACSQPENNIEQPKGNDSRIWAADIPETSLVQGQLIVKVNDDLAGELEASMNDDGSIVVTKASSLESCVSLLGVTKMERLFPHAGKFEARTRAEGLHRWYKLYYDESHASTKAAHDVSVIEGIEIIECVPEIHIVGSPVVTEMIEPMSVASPSAALPFNDPLLSTQWHYYNDGSASGSQSGCDINVFPIWENYTTGDDDVIVGVVDGGIDYKHEDLADNMWHNPGKNEDFRYGYNFCDNTFKITAHDHGTHVAGTIAAVNNNGKGVSGIAGGNTKKGKKGVKLMSCQIFQNGGSGSGSGATAIKWSADNGAVISQNSWGYTDLTTTPESLKAAVDYFIKYAGLDENGKQVGPMAGGIVIFAAGNEDRDVSSTSYESILSVSSVGADYKRAYYSCYGNWCDVAAPGGDVKKGNQVVSTLPGDKYGKMQGTSMACPHVSGVAALILSQYGGQGFTPKALWDRIVNNARDISAYNRNYYMGTGLVDAYRSIAGTGGVAPETVKSFTVTSSSNNIDFKLTVPRDEDDKKPNTILIYFDTKPISSTDDLMFASFYVGDLTAGSEMTGRISGLEFNTKYYLTAVACDLAGNKSGKSAVVETDTGGNNAPVITPPLQTKVSLKPHERLDLDFSFSDPDDHHTFIELIKGSEAEILDTLVMTSPSLDIIAANAPTGTYESKIVVTDVYGLSSSMSIEYTILENHVPEVVAQIPDQFFGARNESAQLKAADFFRDEDGEVLSYTITNSDEDVANINYSNGILYITAMKFGSAEVNVKVTDIRKATAEQTFRILVRDDKEPFDIYPNPVTDFLYVRSGKTVNAQIDVVSSTGQEVYSAEQEVSGFAPAKIDMTSCPPGAYVINLTFDGQQYKQNIVKI